MLGFPCNQFGNQEPGTESEILEFVTSRYQVDFPMFSKVEVNGDGACELYRRLKAAQPGGGPSPEVTWNFEKFLVGRDGVPLRRFPPQTTPDDLAALLPDILST